MEPTISVLVPTYNCLDSLPILKSKISEYFDSALEIILYDNKSTDGTFKYLEDLAQTNSKIRAFQQSRNVGALKNFSDILSVARGKYCLIITAEDSLELDSIQKMVAALEREPNSAICIPSIHVVLKDGSPVYEVNMKFLEHEKSFRPRSLKNYWNLLHHFPGTSIYGVFRTEIIQRLLPIPIIRGGDLCFLRAIAMQHEIVFCPEATLVFETRDSYNTWDQDSRFFFGELDENTFRPTRLKRPILNMFFVDLQYLIENQPESPFKWAGLLFTQLIALTRLLFVKLIGQFINKTLPLKMRNHVLSKFYLKCIQPKFVRNARYPLYFYREVLPQCGIRKNSK